MRRSDSSSGFTLLEMLLAIAILGIALGVSAAGFASLSETPEAAAVAALHRARARAIASGRVVRSDSVAFLPDGRALGPNVDPITGALPRAP